MDHAKLLGVLTSLPFSHAILPHAVYFATSSPANHAICSFIDSSGYASWPIRRCLFIYYIIIHFIFAVKAYDGSVSPNKRLGAFCGARTRNVQKKIKCDVSEILCKCCRQGNGILDGVLPR